MEIHLNLFLYGKPWQNVKYTTIAAGNARRDDINVQVKIQLNFGLNARQASLNPKTPAHCTVILLVLLLLLYPQIRRYLLVHYAPRTPIIAAGCGWQCGQFLEIGHDGVTTAEEAFVENKKY